MSPTIEERTQALVIAIIVLIAIQVLT